MAEIERLKVRAYTSIHNFTGCIRVLPQQRLLDVLNGVLRGALRTNEEFLLVSDVEMCSLDGRKVTLQSAYINKASILFVKEIEKGQARQLNRKVGHKLYPFVNKSTIAVKAYMPFYTLTGQIHYAKGKGLWEMLNSEMRFLPLTDVEICPSAGRSEPRVSFVAVNKEQILSLEELGTP